MDQEGSAVLPNKFKDADKQAAELLKKATEIIGQTLKVLEKTSPEKAENMRQLIGPSIIALLHFKFCISEKENIQQVIITTDRMMVK